MYLVKALRLFVGTSAERTASGIGAFLPGDEYHETDTSDTFQHDGAAWIQKNSPTPPGGADTQLQYNNGGAFGGATALIYDDVNGRLGIGITPESKLHVHESAGGTPLEVRYSSGISTAGLVGTIERFVGKNDAAESVIYADNQVWIDDATDGAEYGRYDLNVITNGTQQSVIRAGSVEVVINNAEIDRNFRIAGNGVTNGIYYDAGNNRTGFGHSAPAAMVHVINTETSSSPENGLVVSNTYSPSSNPGASFPQSMFLFSDFNSTISPSSGFQIAEFLQTVNGGNGTINGRCLDMIYQNLGSGTVTEVRNINIRTPTNSGGGAITTMYGLRVQPQNVATTNYAIYTEAGLVRFGDNVTIDTTVGALTIPRLTTAQQNALTGVNGMLIYNTSTNKFRGYASGAWTDLH